MAAKKKTTNVNPGAKDRAIKVLNAHPDWKLKQVAEKANCSVPTVQNAKEELVGGKPKAKGKAPKVTKAATDKISEAVEAFREAELAKVEAQADAYREQLETEIDNLLARAKPPARKSIAAA